jgi:DNA modification methylase
MFGPHTEWVLGRRCRKQLQFSAHLWLVQMRERQPYQGHLESPLIFYDKKAQMPKGYKPHPCSKPVEELLVVVSQLTKPGDVVLDCFCGLGSTLLACERLGRLWIGCDRSPNYFRFGRGCSGSTNAVAKGLLKRATQHPRPYQIAEFPVPQETVFSATAKETRLAMSTVTSGFLPLGG